MSTIAIAAVAGFAAGFVAGWLICRRALLSGVLYTLVEIADEEGREL